MKYQLTFIASLILIGVSAYSPNIDWTMNELDHDIIDFLKIMPVRQILNIVEKYNSDPEMIAIGKYVMSDEFRQLLYTVEDLQEFKNFVLYLQEAGYNKIREMKALHVLLRMRDYVPPQPSNLMVETGYGGLNGFINEIVAVLPKEKIQELHQQKLVKSAAFAKFNSYVLSEKYVQIENALNSKNEYKKLKERSNAVGLDIQAINKFKYQLLGF
ncbi:protein G12-like [Vespa mandarinia]|uniref:protein G12-like n=1 Tax=Vespa mandarinia TaxID=7446 RepID=UPI00160F796B|nr:protein G12-like [Vespa mandarinia]